MKVVKILYHLKRKRLARSSKATNPGAKPAGVSVRNYTTLEDHPELVLYAGSLNKRTNKVTLATPSPEKAA